MDVMFVPHNAYHTRNFAHSLSHLDAEYIFVDVEEDKHEGTREAILQLELPSVAYHEAVIQDIRPRLIVVMNDWGSWPADLVRLGRQLNIPTAALVEGVQDFTDSHIEHTGAGEARHPYQHAEFPLLIGEYDRKFITSPKARVVGCPRFDDLLEEEVTFPPEPKVSINSNFSYGLYTDIQSGWLQSAVQACHEECVSYHISQHHADFGVPDELNTFEGTMYDSIRQASVFVSRFSTGILEAMCLGKPAIYFNPHGERQDAFQDSMGAYPIAHNAEELTAAIRQEIERPDARREARLRFLSYHIGELDRGASRRLAHALTEILEETRDREVQYETPSILGRLRRWAVSLSGPQG